MIISLEVNLDLLDIENDPFKCFDVDHIMIIPRSSKQQSRDHDARDFREAGGERGEWRVFHETLITFHQKLKSRKFFPFGRREIDSHVYITRLTLIHPVNNTSL